MPNKIAERLHLHVVRLALCQRVFEQVSNKSLSRNALLEAAR